MLEALETRAVMTYTYPFGAMPDDTGEFLLGDVLVNVVLMESDPGMWPYDNNPTSDPVHPGRGYPEENWVAGGSGINSIAAVKQKVEDSQLWWKETLLEMFPNAPEDILNFHFNWQYADNPVHTGFEPIARISNDFAGDLSVNSVITSATTANQFRGGSSLSSIDDFYTGADLYFTSGALNGKHGRVVDYVGATKTFVFDNGTFSSTPSVGDTFGFGKGWMYDFLSQVGFANTGNFSTDIRAYNNFTRQNANADWAFTIFVVNNADDFVNDDDHGLFAAGGAMRQAFSYPGGRFMIVPASRETKTFAHETGHQFWAMDEYLGGGSYTDSRGYYNTPNLNAVDNPVFPVDELQSVSKFNGNVTDGSFRLTLNLAGGITVTTQEIPYLVSAGGIQTAINMAANGVVPGWTNGDISVTGGPLTSNSVSLNFRGGSVDGLNHGATSVNGANLIGGTAGSVVQNRNGRPGSAEQVDSIMAGDISFTATPPDPAPPAERHFTNAFNNNVSSITSLAMIGWQDTNTAYGGVANNGIFDVLDVPFTLSGYGQYKSTSSSGGKYEFRGFTKVNTLPNLNPEGNQNDITINQIRVVEVSIDGGAWDAFAEYDPRVYSTDVSIDVPVGLGYHEIRIRSRDTRTGVTSNIFVGETDAPTQDSPAGVNGVVFIDSNTNASFDTGEPLRPGVGLEVTGTDNMPLELMHEVEPSEWPQDTVLTNVDDEAVISTSTGGTVFARAFSPSSNKVFASANLGTWSASQQFHVAFNSPVSTVSLRASGISGTQLSYGRLEAYKADGTLLARYNTGGLSSGGFTTMTISRAEGDIDYIVAFGRLGTEIVLDSLTWGPAAASTTNSNGVYSLGYLPDGTYRVFLTPPAGFVVTTPSGGYATISVVDGRMAGSVNFGISNSGPFFPFHNYANRFNVDNDDGNNVAPNDALTIVNYLNAFTEAEGEIAPEHDPNVYGFVDVNGDGFCAPNDALEVINYINSGGYGEGEGGDGGGGPGGQGNGGQGNGGGGESEYTVETPSNAAEYFAQNPLHLESASDTHEHHHDDDHDVDELVHMATDTMFTAESGFLEGLLASSAKQRGRQTVVSDAQLPALEELALDVWLAQKSHRSNRGR